MRHYARRGGRARGSGGDGGFWLTFSDLMSALLLVFVLVMFYSVYQYLGMFETYKEQSVELEARSAELWRQTGLLSEKQEELETKDAQLQTSQQRLTDSEREILTQQALLLLTQQEVDSSKALLEQQQQELEATRAQLADQEAVLGQARALLASQQATVTQQQTQLQYQQGQMILQQERLDELVGVRAQIVQSLGEALNRANIKARVDPRTGSITLDASVLFDVGRYDLKESGKAVLDEFLPVYLSVLMSPENEANIAEIIIEGHTDTDGSYMSNLRLSQNRAYSVMAYILDDNNRAITGTMKYRLRRIATANGRSFSNPILDENGQVDKTASRRVEFKFRMQDEQMIEDMRRLLEGFG